MSADFFYEPSKPRSMSQKNGKPTHKIWFDLISMDKTLKVVILLWKVFHYISINTRNMFVVFRAAMLEESVTNIKYGYEC